MKMLLDYHHHDLWESMELLCERLGWDLYRPIGMDWFTEDYWVHEKKWYGDAIARQYLEPWGSDEVLEPKGTLDVEFDGLGPDPSVGHRVRLDKSHNRYIKLLTIEQARDLRPDIVISSLAHNHEGFARFASEVGATFGLQVGNVRFGPQDMAEDRWDLAAFGLVSGIMPAPVEKPHVVYHQEFSLDDFRYEPPPRRHDGIELDHNWATDEGKKSGFRVSSFVQCYPQDEKTYPMWCETAPRAPDLDWRVFGAYGEAPQDQYAAGNIDTCAGVAEAMRASDVAWHAKRWSDGFGHVIHNWFAVGRPLFGFYHYYRDQMAGPLFEEGVTTFDFEGKSPDEIVALLRMLRDDPEKHERMCLAAAQRFREVVNYDEEEQAIRAMFAQVLP